MVVLPVPPRARGIGCARRAGDDPSPGRHRFRFAGARTRSSFPVDAFRVVLDDVLDRSRQNAPSVRARRPAIRGFEAYIADRLARRGVRCSAEHVLIVNGSQQALDLICRALLDPGDRVALESPTYSIVLPLLAQYQAQLEEIPMTPRGLDVSALEASIARGRPKLLFTMPTFHNPTGITMDGDVRRRLIDVASRERVPIVEDDFDSELRYDGESVPPLKALDEHGCVIHIGTFSKGLFPGVRLGWIVGPREVIGTLVRAKLIADYHTSLLLQAAVLEFCERGHYDDHLARLGAIYRNKADALVQAMKRHFPDGVTWTMPEGGFAFWLTLPDGVSAESLLADSAKAGVLFTEGSQFFANANGRRHLRISISRVPLDRIDDGVARLGAVLKRLLRAGPRSSDRVDGREQEPALHI